MPQSRSLALAVAVLSAAATAPAQLTSPIASIDAERHARKPRVIIRPALPCAIDERRDVIVKFREGLRVRLRDGAWRNLTTDGASATLATLHDLTGTATIERLFTRDERELDDERARLLPRAPADEEPLADLNNYYRVRATDAAHTAALVNTLNRDPRVEVAYAEPRYGLADAATTPLPGDLPPTTPDLVLEQDYLVDAPDGVTYHAMSSIVGARFPDGEMAQLEGAWHFDHEDCSQMLATNLLGVQPAPPWNTLAWTDHGTACLGIMCADRNGYGMVGFGNATRRAYMCSMSNGAANMISLATGVLPPGSVMSTSVAPFIGTLQTPLDFLQAEFDACRAAAAAGICFTLAAGNGTMNLADPAFGGRYAPGAASSGAFMIAATLARGIVPAGFTNWGERIDCNNWGWEVATLGYGTLFWPNFDVRQGYTETFGGTSAASAITAGVIATLIGSVFEQNGVLLGVEEIRTALRTTGTQMAGPFLIGTRPDLAELLALYGLPDGLLVTRNGTPAGTFDYELSGNAGEPYALLLSPGRGRIPLGLNRPLLLDPTFLLTIDSGPFPAGGTRSVTFPLPNDPGLVDTDLYLQAGIVRSGTIHLTNSAELWIQ